MSIMDVFSGKAGRNAALWQANQLQGSQNQALGSIDQGVGAGTAALNAGLQGGLGALGQGRDDINANYAQGQGYLGQLPAVYAPWTGAGGQASGAQADFLGLNGVGGGSAADAALANWRGATGYRDIVDQSTDAAARKAASLGMAGSGNTLDAITRIGGQLANQSGQQYFGNLGELSGRGLQAAGQVGAGLTAQANLAGQQGNALGTLGTQGANLWNQNSQGLANLNSQGGLGKAQVGANLGSQMGQAGYNGALAGQQASATGLNFGLSALGSLANLGKMMVPGGSFVK